MTNIAPRLRAQLDSISLRQLRGIAAVAEIHGARAYLVGGAVRDALLGLPVTDIDIAVVGMTSGLPRGVARALNGRVVAHSQFNTYSLAASGRHIDLAMARHESYTHPGALPTVTPGTLHQDLARRDFAINAMAVSLGEDSFGEFLDPFDGQSDLRTGIVRVLHDDSFRDDATRILRAARYAVRLRFALEPNAERLLRHDSSYLDTISAARLRDEFERVLQENKAAVTLEMLQDLGALKAVYPAITLTPATSQALQSIRDHEQIDSVVTSLSVLVNDMTEQDRSGFVERLAMNARWRKVIDDTALLQEKLREGPPITNETPRSEIYTLLQSLEEEAILGCALLADSTLVRQLMMLYLYDLRDVRPFLNGSDLLALGVPVGPRVGELLHDLLMARLDQQVVTRQDELDFIRARL